MTRHRPLMTDDDATPPSGDVRAGEVWDALDALLVNLDADHVEARAHLQVARRVLVNHVRHRTSRVPGEATASLRVVEDACDRAIAALLEEATKSAEAIVAVRERTAALRAATAGGGDARRPECWASSGSWRTQSASCCGSRSGDPAGGGLGVS